MNQVETEKVLQVARTARHRLIRARTREFLRSHFRFVLLIALALAALRPILWPLGPELSGELGWATAIVRSCALFLSTLCAGGAVLALVSRVRRPTLLTAARALDDAALDPEALASGLAFGSLQDEPTEFERLSIDRAVARANSIDVRTLLPLPSLWPSRSALLYGLGGSLLALCVGAYDPGLVAAITSPPTVLEQARAASLSQAAEELVSADASSSEPEEETDEATERMNRLRQERRQQLSERAERAAELAQSGQRERALSELSELRSEASEAGHRSRDLSRALSELSAALESETSETAEGVEQDGAEEGGAQEGGAQASAAASASEQLSLLARRAEEAEGQSEAERAEQARRMLSRLSRGSESLRRQRARSSTEEGAAEQEHSRALSEAIERARDALAEGDLERAAEHLAEAAQRAESMQREQSRAASEGEAVAQMSSASSALERALQRAMLGQEGGESTSSGEASAPGEGPGEGSAGAGDGESGASSASDEERAALRRALSERLAQMGSRGGSPSTAPGPGHIPDDQSASRSPLEVSEGLQAGSRVDEGERVVQAIRGLGVSGEPSEPYREVFPEYDSIAEESVQDERVPPLRRTAVRRYFESIRPSR